MQTEYRIPHNYKNNGRIFNMFEKKALTKSLVWLVPVTIIVFNLPIAIDNKFFFTILLGAPVSVIFLLQLDEAMMQIIRFKKNRKVYYDIESEMFEKSYYEEARIAKGIY